MTNPTDIAASLSEAQIDRIIEAATLWRPHRQYGYEPGDRSARYCVTDGAGNTDGDYSYSEASDICTALNRAAVRTAILEE